MNLDNLLRNVTARTLSEHVAAIRVAKAMASLALQLGGKLEDEQRRSAWLSNAIEEARHMNRQLQGDIVFFQHACSKSEQRIATLENENAALRDEVYHLKLQLGIPDDSASGPPPNRWDSENELISYDSDMPF